MLVHSHPIGTTDQSNVNRAFIIGIVLNLAFVVVEFGSGLYLNSLALISDAGHNLSDVAALALAMLGFRLTKVKPNALFTYGLRKSTILISLLNAIILLVVVIFIAWESIIRFRHGESVQGEGMAVVAGIGILINTITALLFFRDRKKDLNIKGAFLHMAADALVSVGVVVTGIVIGFTSWYWLDTVVSLAIVVVIIISTWGLLRDSTVLVLDGVPRGINLQEVQTAILQFPGVEDVHHVHIWAMSTTENALTAHISVGNNFKLSSFESLKKEIRSALLKLGVQHVTLELETKDERCRAGEV